MEYITQLRRYWRKESVVFCKTKDPFGELSNMAPGFPLEVGGKRFRGAEALYQAARFPHRPDVQQMILAQASPVEAKRVSRVYLTETRPDWERVKVKVMRWVLRVKLAQHYERFGRVLGATGNRAIVELSLKDRFWGARPEGEWLVGVNALGRLLMELRELYRQKSPAEACAVEPPEMESFLFFGMETGKWG